MMSEYADWDKISGPWNPVAWWSLTIILWGAAIVLSPAWLIVWMMYGRKP